MPTRTYLGTLADIGLGLLSGLRPAVRVRPVEAAYDSTDGALISAVGVPVVVTAGTGAFSVNLVPSGDLTGAVSGTNGIDYLIEVGRFEDTVAGSRFHGTDVYRFTAVAGGGNISEMQGGSLLAVWIGPPWPSPPLPVGFYIDTTPPNEYGVVRS